MTMETRNGNFRKGDATTRASNARRSSMTTAAAAAAAASRRQKNGMVVLVEAICYRGHEVIMACTHHTLQVICARTRSILQTFSIPTQHHNNNKNKIVALDCNHLSGLICVTTNCGRIYTFYAVPTIPQKGSKQTTHTSSKSTTTTTTQHPPTAMKKNVVVTVYGRYAWIEGKVIVCRKAFPRMLIAEEEQWIVSSSLDKKVLVAHNDQLAVYDASTTLLLWTTRTFAKIIHATISGDARAIVLVLEREGVGVPHPHGARTYLRESISSSSDTSTKPPLFDPLNVSRSHSNTLLEPPPIPHSDRYIQEEVEVDNQEYQDDDEVDEDVWTLNEQDLMGILFKPGPFLVHSGPVTKATFRGQGSTNSSYNHNEEEESGNDLLLTCCSSDGTMRIFSQASWKQLMHWTTPPGVSRADWIQGITASNLGDLEPPPKSSSSSRTTSNNYQTSTGGTTTNSSALDDSQHSAGINHHLLYETNQQQQMLPSHPIPSGAAGAWISELTFRGPFPALRLSRLSYLKDAAPAHFESVAAILPPGALSSQLQDCLTVQGIWPAWNAWEKPPSHDLTHNNNQTLSGSAMALLGATVKSGSTYNGLGEGAPMDGTHSPPCELRLVTSKKGDHSGVILMEFPLWGDREFGAMELGSPLRYCLTLNEEEPLLLEPTTSTITLSPTHACLDIDFTSKLTATIRPDGQSISTVWRKPGTMSILPMEEYSKDVDTGKPGLKRTASTESIASTTSIDSTESQTSFQTYTYDAGIRCYQDLSLTPCPLALPSIVPPTNLNECFSILSWWPDENFGGPPRLVVITEDTGTLLVYEMPPPWSALEPAMPAYDPFAASNQGATNSFSDFDKESDPGHHSYEEDDFDGSEDGLRMEYDVKIVPHPDFGLGLRLDAQVDGMPALAGSYKKHPLSGGMLPAERTGKIVLGDELVSVNGVSLEAMNFENIISTIRRVGFDTKKGDPLCIRFRHSKSSAESTALASSTSGSSGVNRRTIDQIFDSNSKSIRSNEESDSQGNATILVGADDEVQQEFSRIFAMVPNAFPVKDGQISLVLLPWNYGKGTDMETFVSRGVTLLVTAIGKKLTAYRLEVKYGNDPEACSNFFELGSVNIGDDNASVIHSLTVVKTATEGWCLAACNEEGNATLVCVDIEECDSSNTEEPKLRAQFRHFPLFDCNRPNLLMEESIKKSFLMRAFSIELLASMPMGIKDCGVVTIWSSLPTIKSVSERLPDGEIPSNYRAIDIYHRGCSDSETIVDFRWVASGSLDTHPWLVTFSRTSAVLHRHPGSKQEWVPVAEVLYPNKFISSNFNPNIGNLSPVEVYPHLIRSLKNIVSASDEQKWLRCDWHPDSILANICTETHGVGFALGQNILGLYKWLSNYLNEDPSSKPLWNSDDVLSTAPLNAVLDENIKPDKKSIAEEKNIESAASLMNSLSLTNKTNFDDDDEKKLLRELQDLLKTNICINSNNKEEKKIKSPLQSVGKYSPDFILAMAAGNPEKINETEKEIRMLPEPIKNLSRDELRFLWAMGEVLNSSQNIQDLDASAQITAFCTLLMRKIGEAKDEEAPSLIQETPSFEFGRHRRKSFLTKPSKPIGNVSTEEKPKTIASAGGLSALLSDCQLKLVHSIRKEGETLDWETVRSSLLPFWLRSDDELKKLSEEIGENLYKKTRNIMDCALFFIITGNRNKLKALAATDRSISGKKFFTFLTSHNFSTQRGRTITEKNAFSLLRKRQYNTAAAFFLIAEPPLMKSALNIIETQMQDYALAFMVARLAEKFLKQPCIQNGGLTIGGGLSLTTMGGGGGFASSSYGVPELNSNKSESKYVDWKPSIGEDCKNFIENSYLPYSKDDSCMQAMMMLWLGREKPASLCLTVRTYSDSIIYTDREPNYKFPSLFNVKPNDQMFNNNEIRFANARILSKSNELINFLSRPLLLKKMNADKIVQWSSGIVLARALCRRGIEIPSSKLLVQLTDPDDLNDAVKTQEKLESSSSQGTHFGSTIHSSSSLENGASSSIFDSFDAAPPRHKTSPAPSIFDSFDTAPPHSKPKPQPPSSVPASGEMSSSIFDSFDSAPPRPISKPQPPSSVPASGEMSSSIFDSFDSAPPRPTSKPQPPSSVPAGGEMSSSIFDSFDAAPSAHSHPKSSQQSAPSKPIDLASPKNDTGIDEQDVTPVPVPSLWLEWRLNLLASAVARRLLREMAQIISRFHGDAVTTPMNLFRRHVHPLVPVGAAEIFHEICPGETVMSSLQDCLSSLCRVNKVAKEPVIEQALILLGFPLQPKRIVSAVLLYSLLDRMDLGEDVIRNASHDQLDRCHIFTNANDDLVYNRKSLHHSSSHFVRRQASMVSWQLELCLWLSRGGTFDISSSAVKEATIAVRIGFLVASWGRSHQNLEHLLKCEPDCLMDQELGRQLWSSMKLISSYNDRAISSGGTSSGGWEFLVDCKRSEATEILRDRNTGSFLLRPHPDDHGVFTLSFKTNLIPTDQPEVSKETPTPQNADDRPKAIGQEDSSNATTSTESKGKPVRAVKKDEVVQHAIVRLSDAGFRCGSFGPFTTLMDLLLAVSTSLPFDLLFDEPPVQGIIQEHGAQPSPNSVFLRKLALCSRSEHYRWNSTTRSDEKINDKGSDKNEIDDTKKTIQDENDSVKFDLEKKMGLFANLLVLTEIRKQLSAIAAAEDEDQYSKEGDANDCEISVVSDDDFGESLGGSADDLAEEEMDALASRMLRPLLYWCRSLEVTLTSNIAPSVQSISQFDEMAIGIDASETAVEMAPSEIGSSLTGGDAVIRRMIQPMSGVEFRTLRVGEGGHSAVVVLFSKKEAISWIISSGAEKDRNEAIERLHRMEKERVIERINLSDLAVGKTFAGLLVDTANHDPEEEIRYRFVDPWEVEVLLKKEDELKSAALGRDHYVTFSVGNVAQACENVQRSLGGLHHLALWTSSKGGISLTKALVSVHSPWERDSGGDLKMLNGVCKEPSPYINSIREHLYRNALFRRLRLPQRFLALIQVELLDLKNLTAPGGSFSLTAYALLRVKRTTSKTTLSHKARTLDSAYTEPKKIGKISGPHAPASWGSIVRFRFALPEDVSCDGISHDKNREALFKGPPCVLQLAVYEKKFMSDISLGGADVKLDALANGGQLEEWVPLRDSKAGITWFARIRLTLRFELMCLESSGVDATNESLQTTCPSVGLSKIRNLSRMGGAQEDSKGVKKSVSTPDFVAYLESMVY